MEPKDFYENNTTNFICDKLSSISTNEPFYIGKVLSLYNFISKSTKYTLSQNSKNKILKHFNNLTNIMN